ncbi:MAG: 3-hydroxyacyl-CoA dehydrogenase family protein [Planctomycetota bacterium]
MSIETIVVVGAGTMGRGIAQMAAQSGYKAILTDLSEDALAAARDGIAAFLEKGVAKGKTTREDADAALERLSTSTDAAAAVADADLLVEAVFEDLDLKKKLFAEWDAAANEGCILASNTSSLPLTAIAGATNRPDKVIGMHFFNPVPIMKLLEIVRADTTSDETLTAALAVGERMGKTNIVVKDSPGFATSRLGLVLGLEAMRMLETGVASAKDIDTAMELGYRHPMGPLKLTDLVGLDVRLSIAEHLAKELDAPHFTPPAILQRLVDEGKTGKKSGEGFYRWEDGNPVPVEH